MRQTKLTFLISKRPRKESQRLYDPYDRDALQDYRRKVKATYATHTSPGEHHEILNTVSNQQDPFANRCFHFLRGSLRTPDKESVGDMLQMGSSSAWDPFQLEDRHDYIQWLFPLRTMGVNYEAPLLQETEGIAIKEDGKTMTNVLKALQMMFRFYGMQIQFKAKSGPRQSEGGSKKIKVMAVITRNPNPKESKRQYENLTLHPHNYLRISRILQFLGEIDLEPVKVGWLQFLAVEVFLPEVDGASPPLAACESSFTSFWIKTLVSPRERERVWEFLSEMEERENWNRKKIAVVVPEVVLPAEVELPS